MDFNNFTYILQSMETGCNKLLSRIEKNEEIPADGILVIHCCILMDCMFEAMRNYLGGPEKGKFISLDDINYQVILPTLKQMVNDLENNKEIIPTNFEF